MPEANRLGDSNNAGGTVDSVSQEWFTIGGDGISTDGDVVSSHSPHTGQHVSPRTAQGSTFFRVGGIPVNRNGDADTCGHTRDSDNSFFIID